MSATHLPLPLAAQLRCSLRRAATAAWLLCALFPGAPLLAATHNLDIAPGTQHLLIVISGEVERVKLSTPAGQQVTREGGGHGIEWHLADATIEISVREPPPGRWQLRYEGRAQVETVANLHLELQPQVWGLDGRIAAATPLPSSVLGRLELDATLRRERERDRDLRLVQVPPDRFRVYTDGRELAEEDHIEVGAWGFAYDLQARYPPAPEPEPIVIPPRPEPRAPPPPPRRGRGANAVPGEDPLAPLMPPLYHSLIGGGFSLLFFIGIALLCLRPRDDLEKALEALAASRATLSQARTNGKARGLQLT